MKSTPAYTVNLLYRTIILLILLIIPSVLHAADTFNLTSGKPFAIRNVRNDNVAHLGESSLPPEGTPWASPEAALFNGADSLVAVDLMTEAPIKALLLQADCDDNYYVEASTDGSNWLPLWEVPQKFSYDCGLTTRTTTLSYPVHARLLRVRAPRTDKNNDAVAISRLQAFSEIPEHWPTKLTYSSPNSKPPLMPRINQKLQIILYLLMATIFLALLTWIVAQDLPGSNRLAKVRQVLIVLFIIAAFFAWPSFLQFHGANFYHLHDLYHYYIGAKYFKELNYSRLYECTAVADMQDNYPKPYLQRIMRNLTDNSLTSTNDILSNPGKCTSNFTADRWNAFKNDIRFFRNKQSFQSWNRTQSDFGYNPTPAWMILGSTTANIIPLSDGFLVSITAIDLLLILASIAMVFRTFGIESALLMSGFFFINHMASFTWTGGSFLRYDWFFLLTTGICSLKKGRDVLAGSVLTYSALLRIFPGVVLFGIFMHAALNAVLSRSTRPLKAYRALLTGSAIALLLLIPLSIAASGGYSSWADFAQNSKKHLKSTTANFMGLPYLIDKNIAPDENRHDWIEREEGKASAVNYKEKIRHRAVAVRVFVTIIYLILFLFAVRRHEKWVAGVVSVGLVPVFFTLSNYYYIMFALLGLLWLVRPAAAYCLCAITWLSLIPPLLTINIEDTWQYTFYTCMSLAFILAVLLATGTKNMTPAKEPANSNDR